MCEHREVLITATQQIVISIVTVEQHNTIPRNQVAVDVFVREVNCCCDIVQKLEENQSNLNFSTLFAVEFPCNDSIITPACSRPRYLTSDFIDRSDYLINAEENSCGLPEF